MSGWLARGRPRAYDAHPSAESIAHGTVPFKAAGSLCGSAVLSERGLLLTLALGNFVLSTGAFVLPALLQPLATDLEVSLPAAGWLMSGYALTYAIGSPVLTGLTRALAPTQQARLVTLLPWAPGLALSLNASGLYAGSAVGGAIGRIIVDHAGLAPLGFGAAALLGAGLLLLWASTRVEPARAAAHTMKSVAPPAPGRSAPRRSHW